MNYHDSRWKRKRARILRRDGYMCRECKRYGKTTGADTIHHIYPVESYSSLTYVDINLLSLCGKCHNGMHNRDDDTLTAKGLEWCERVSPHLEGMKI